MNKEPPIKLVKQHFPQKWCRGSVVSWLMVRITRIQSRQNKSDCNTSLYMFFIKQKLIANTRLSKKMVIKAEIMN